VSITELGLTHNRRATAQGQRVREPTCWRCWICWAKNKIRYSIHIRDNRYRKNAHCSGTWASFDYEYRRFETRKLKSRITTAHRAPVIRGGRRVFLPCMLNMRSKDQNTVFYSYLARFIEDYSTGAQQRGGSVCASLRVEVSGCEEKHSHTAAHHPVVKPPAAVSTAVSHTPTQQQGWGNYQEPSCSLSRYPTVHVEYVEQRPNYGILFICSLLCEYMNLEYVGTLHAEYAERRITYGILFIFSPFYVYSNLASEHIPV